MDFYDAPLAARLYDLQHEGDPLLEAEAGVVLDFLEEARGEPALELGCGTGRLLLEALGRGLAVEGVDGSAVFLERLRERAGERGLEPRLREARLDDTGLPAGRYARIFAAFRTLDHLVAPGERAACLAEACRLLAPGGLLLLSVANPEPEQLLSLDGALIRMRDDLHDPVSGRDFSWWMAALFDPASGVIEQTFRYDFRDGAGRIVEQYEFAQAMCHVADEALRAEAAAAGLVVESVAGGFAGEPYAPGQGGEALWRLRRMD